MINNIQAIAAGIGTGLGLLCAYVCVYFMILIRKVETGQPIHRINWRH